MTVLPVPVQLKVIPEPPSLYWGPTGRVSIWAGRMSKVLVSISAELDGPVSCRQRQPTKRKFVSTSGELGGMAKVNQPKN
jgi:hypothetical protein